MKPFVPVAWGFMSLLGTASLMIAWRGYARARDYSSLELQRRAVLISQLQKLHEMRPVAAHWQRRQRPASGLAALLSETLASCGVGRATLANVSPQPATEVLGAPGTEGLKRQRATFTLAPITLPQLGAFLDAWRTREPNWIVATIDVAPEPGRLENQTPPTKDLETAGRKTEAGDVGGDLPLRAVLTLDAVYLDDPKGERK